MNYLRFILISYLVFSIKSYSQTEQPSSNQQSQSSSSIIPHLEKQGTATRLVVQGKPILLQAVELHNSTC